MKTLIITRKIKDGSRRLILSMRHGGIELAMYAKARHCSERCIAVMGLSEHNLDKIIAVCRAAKREIEQRQIAELIGGGT
jgi:hypothetical protein